MKEKNKTSIDLAIENLISIQPLLSKSFTRSLRAKTNLNPGSLYVLGVLVGRETLSMTEIGCKLSMPKPHVTSLVDKLIAEEMVERLYDPNDRRIVNVRITKKGLTDFKAIKLDISQELRQNLELLGNDEIENLSLASLQVKDILMKIMVEKSTCANTNCCKEE